MLYECLVIDNSNFFINGTIRVRLKNDVSSSLMMKDLSENPKQSINEFGNQRIEKYGDEREFKYDDRDVRISTSIGGAYDYGVFILPQPNTWGLVAEVGTYDDNLSDPRFVWIGALAMFNNKKESINIPSDSLEELNGYQDKKINLEKPYSGLVFKQKETHIADNAKKITDESGITLDWRQRPTQNMIVINENKVFVIHNNFDEDGTKISESSLTLDRNGAKTQFIDMNGSKSELTLNNDGTFVIMSNNAEENITNMLSSTKETLSLSHSDNLSDANLYMGSGTSGLPQISLNISEKGQLPTEIIMDSKTGMTINSNKDISINPGQNGTVSLGTGEGYILTTTTPGTWNYDNHTVTATRNAKA